MRKVVGSNLGEDLYRTSLFFAETTSLKRDCYVTVKPGLLETTSSEMRRGKKLFESTLKQKLLSASARALKVCWKSPGDHISFESLHLMSKRATPDQFMKYKLALCLHKLYNIQFNTREFCLLNVNQILTSRQTHFISLKSNNHRVGINRLSNRLYVLNKAIPLDWLNDSSSTYKIKCKKLMLM